MDRLHERQKPVSKERSHCESGRMKKVLTKATQVRGKGLFACKLIEQVSSYWQTGGTKTFSKRM